MVFDIIFDAVPSVNEYIREAGRSAFHAGKFEKKWRVVGHRTLEPHVAHLGVTACRRADGTTGIRLRRPACPKGVYVRWVVYRDDRKVRDSAFNLYTKPIEDGFTDAGLWPGDDDRYILGRVTEVGRGTPHVACQIYVFD